MTAHTPPPGQPVPATLGRRLAANVLDSLVYLGLSLACLLVPFLVTQSLEGIIVGYAVYVVAATVYALVVLPMNALARRRSHGVEPEPESPTEEVILLREIRDLLGAGALTREP